MRTRQIRLTLPAELADEIRTSAERAEQSVSEWVAETVGHRLRNEAFDHFLEEWEREHGALTPEELARAEVRWLTARVSGGAEAAASDVRREALASAMAEWASEYGAFTGDEMKEARRDLGIDA